MIVVDTTVLAPFLLRSSSFSSAVKVSSKDPLWVVPPEWRLEFLNELSIHVQAGRGSVEDAYARLEAAEFLVRISHERFDDLTILVSAAQMKTGALEAIHVLTARRLGAKLVTNRANILAACPDVAVSLETFGAA
jgi:predicted nucleic acid-binding protein